MHKQYHEAYVWTALQLIIWYFTSAFKNKAIHMMYLLLIHIRTGFSMLLFAKITKMTQLSLRQADYGKITNLLVNDLAVF